MIIVGQKVFIKQVDKKNVSPKNISIRVIPIFCEMEVHFVCIFIHLVR